MVVNQCTHWVNENGATDELTQYKKDDLAEIVTDYAKKSYRTILMAYKELDKDEFEQICA